ncbi:unnamed protein product [Prorocentrum cordatum]|uniref:Uncharacterized protein n=1 Tax=Prorocentrum cordatum TaxID=2364126 RepID=A0ABN9UKZ2_9DINO|nr:unnamed protein product [Polarella glacialis]
MVGPFSARGLSDGVMTTALSAAAMSAFDAPSAGKPATSDDDEGDVSTVDVCSRRASSESEAEASWALSPMLGPGASDGCPAEERSRGPRRRAGGPAPPWRRCSRRCRTSSVPSPPGRTTATTRTSCSASASSRAASPSAAGRTSARHASDLGSRSAVRVRGRRRDLLSELCAPGHLA